MTTNFIFDLAKGPSEASMDLLEDDNEEAKGLEHVVDVAMGGRPSSEKSFIPTMGTTLELLMFNYTNIKELNEATKEITPDNHPPHCRG